MKISWLMLATVLAVAGCDDVTVTPLDGGAVPPNCPALPDLAPPMTKCDAAKGVGGDNLLCTDLTAIASLDALRGMGWSVGKDSMSNECWSVGSGAPLQIKNIGGFTGTCSLSLPAIDLKDAKYSQYSTVTLSIRHKVDLDLGTMEPNQLAQVYLETASPARLVSQTSGTQLEQQWVVSIEKQKLPAALNSVYKFLLQMSVLTAKSTGGWQISSIAINGSK